MSVKYSSSPFNSQLKFSDIESLNKTLNKIPNKKVFIIDEKVWDIFEEPLRFLVGKNPLIFLSAEEKKKSLKEVAFLLEWLAIHNISRNDSIIAIGGGIILDIAGFAASIFKRGCRLVFIPTTFVGMIDAAIGGKNGINYSADKNSSIYTKNLIGNYYPATHIIICLDFLETLEEIDLLNGWAECIKVSLILPNKLYHSILKSEKIISKNVVRDAVTVKEKLCRNDLYDKSTRRKLNLGHTFAHLIESASQFEIPHGIAVAIGIRAAAKLSFNTQRIDEQTVTKILKPLDMFGFPKAMPLKYHQAINKQGTAILAKDKKKTQTPKVILFTGFQSTRIVSGCSYEEVIDALLSL